MANTTCVGESYPAFLTRIRSHRPLPPSDFSNILSKTTIERLADADEYEVVKEVQVRAVPSAHGVYPDT